MGLASVSDSLFHPSSGVKKEEDLAPGWKGETVREDEDELNNSLLSIVFYAIDLFRETISFALETVIK